MSKQFERLCGLVRKAVKEYDMIQPGDRIRVAVSGGKDSVALAMALSGIKKYLGVDFSLTALTLDMGFSGGGDFSRLKELFDRRGLEYTVKKTDIGPIIFEQRKEANPCSLCARMRRGALHDAAKEMGCNKIALGHHLDDAIETFYMNLWNEGRIGTFSPVTYLSRKDVTVIRPLVLASEGEVINAVKNEGFPVVKSACPADGVTNRQNMKNFVSYMCRKDSSFRKKSLNAFQKKDLDGWGIKGE